MSPPRRVKSHWLSRSSRCRCNLAAGRRFRCAATDAEPAARRFRLERTRIVGWPGVYRSTPAKRPPWKLFYYAAAAPGPGDHQLTVGRVCIARRRWSSSAAAATVLWPIRRRGSSERAETALFWYDINGQMQAGPVCHQAQHDVARDSVWPYQRRRHCLPHRAGPQSLDGLQDLAQALQPALARFLGLPTPH